MNQEQFFPKQPYHHHQYVQHPPIQFQEMKSHPEFLCRNLSGYSHMEGLVWIFINLNQTLFSQFLIFFKE